MTPELFIGRYFKRFEILNGNRFNIIKKETSCYKIVGFNNKSKTFDVEGIMYKFKWDNNMRRSVAYDWHFAKSEHTYWYYENISYIFKNVAAFYIPFPKSYWISPAEESDYLLAQRFASIKFNL